MSRLVWQGLKAESQLWLKTMVVVRAESRPLVSHLRAAIEDDLKPRVRRRSEENQAEDNQEAMPTTSAAMLAPGSLDQETQKQLRAP
ncbi:MAG: hypothetical protein R2865_15775 [Deinococcales bacterium]